jgi:valyl-tRNA synthetase
VLDLIRCNVERYVQASNHEQKRVIIFEIIDSIEQKGRFIKSKGRDWAVLDREEARKKVAHALQYRLRRTLR